MRVIHVLRKPLSEGTVAANTLTHGTGGLNIDASRIAAPGESIETHSRSPEASAKKNRPVYGEYGPLTTHQTEGQKQGRWPANVILQHLDGCRCDGVRRVKPSNGSGRAGAGSSGFQSAYIGGDSKAVGFTGGSVAKDGTETVANWICEPECPVARLDEQSGSLKSGVAGPKSRVYGNGTIYGTSDKALDSDACGYNDTGGASRFYKQVGGKVDD